jgi:hypothetical protein
MRPGHRAADRHAMTSLQTASSLSVPTPATIPSRWRRAGIAVAGVLACLVPTVFAVNLTRMLLTGELADHQFHQLTGQGLILCALWIGGPIAIVRAGWVGRRPSTAAGLLHLAFALCGLATAFLAPGGGLPLLMTPIVLTGLLVWAAVPLRPRLTRSAVQVDPLLAPVALLAAGFYTPYAVAQIGLQNEAVGHHAQNPHFSDMAWTVIVLVVLAVLAAVLPVARRLMTWTGVASVVIGVGGLAFGEGTAWSLTALTLGAVALGALAVRRRLDPR